MTSLYSMNQFVELEQFNNILIGVRFGILLTIAVVLLMERRQYNFVKATALAMFGWCTVLLFSSPIHILSLQEYYYWHNLLILFKMLVLPFCIMMIYTLIHQKEYIYKLLFLSELPLVSFFILYACIGSNLIYNVSLIYTFCYGTVAIFWLSTKIVRFNKKLRLGYADLQDKDLSWVVWVFASLAIGFFIFIFNAKVNNLYISTFFDLFSICVWIYVALRVRVQKPISDAIMDVEESIIDNIIDTEESMDIMDAEGAIINNIISENPEKRKAVILTPEQISSLKEKVTEFMDENHGYLNCDLDIASMAQEIGTNTKYLSLFINNETGCNFASFVTGYRLNHAIQLMTQKDTTLTLEEIAYKSGFNTPNTFFRAFRKKYSCPPRQYQKNMK